MHWLPWYDSHDFHDLLLHPKKLLGIFTGCLCFSGGLDPSSLTWVFVFLHLHLLMSPFLIHLLSKLPYSRSSWSSTTPAVGKRYSCDKCCLRGDPVQRKGVSHKERFQLGRSTGPVLGVRTHIQSQLPLFFFEKKKNSTYNAAQGFMQVKSGLHVFFLSCGAQLMLCARCATPHANLFNDTAQHKHMHCKRNWSS